MRWEVHGERIAYDSPWVQVALVDVELPGGERIAEHHVVRAPLEVGGCLVHDPGADAVLLIRRHRFIPDTWGWEVPAGRLEPGEAPADGAVREVLEETGWRPAGPPEHLATFNPSAGLLRQTFHAFAVTGARHEGPAVDAHEAAVVRWVPVAEVAALLDEGEVRESLSLVALHTWLRHRSLAGDVVRPARREGDRALRGALREGRVVRLPARRTARLVVLDHLARLVEPGIRLPERALDDLLRSQLDDEAETDHVSIRRHLVDEGYLTRAGGVYWRSGGHVDTGDVP